MEYFKQSNILNPYCPWWFNLGPVFTHFSNGHYQQALEFANRIHIPGVFWNCVFKIAALSQLSRTKEGTELADKFLVEFPGKAEATCFVLRAVLFDEIVYQRISEGFKKAGLPVL